MTPQMKEELKKAETMRQILDICHKYYDLNQPLGIATKIIVIGGLEKVINIIKAPPKNGN